MTVKQQDNEEAGVGRVEEEWGIEKQDEVSKRKAG
jgi:hypothetical protein